MMCERVYFVQCMKRSTIEKKVWWSPNRRGYTEDMNEAGKYTGAELDQCAVSYGDWIAHPYWVQCASRMQGFLMCDGEQLDLRQYI